MSGPATLLPLSVFCHHCHVLIPPRSPGEEFRSVPGACPECEAIELSLHEEERSEP